MEINEKDCCNPKDEIHNIHLYCGSLNFGKIELSHRENNFYRRFNHAILSLCRSIPVSVQADTLFFLMKYGNIQLGHSLDFFARYYPPVWSILHWISRKSPYFSLKIKKEDVSDAITVHAMAMLLHSLDDHLADYQIPVSHLTLLLRSQAWLILNDAMSRLVKGVSAGEKTAWDFIGDYHAAFQESADPVSLDDYCQRFTRQMAIGMVAPFLLSMKISENPDFTQDILAAFRAFGIAWRLLDDINDIGDDISSGTHNAVYYCLPEQLKTLWNRQDDETMMEEDGTGRTIFYYLEECGVIHGLKERICAELTGAEKMMVSHGMKGLAREFRCLAAPLK